jgi:hypothetical protein
MVFFIVVFSESDLRGDVAARFSVFIHGLLGVHVVAVSVWRKARPARRKSADEIGLGFHD